MSQAVDQDSRFLFRANAYLVGGYMARPYLETLETQGACVLPMVGGGGGAKVDEYAYRDLISFRRGESKVLGNVDHAYGKRVFNTLATASIEDLNIAGLITADRVVARLVSERSEAEDELPMLPVGSYIENLRIAGRPVELPPHDLLFNTRFMKDLDVPRGSDLVDSTGDRLTVPRLDSKPLGNDRLLFQDTRVLTSLFSPPGDLPPGSRVGGSGVYPWGIKIPGFGTVYFGEYLVSRFARRLTMVRVKMGSPEEGEVQLVSTEGNGCTYP